MAITDSTSKSIIVLLGIGVLGTVFVVSTALLRNRKSETPVISKPYSEPESGLVFNAPSEWSVGSASGNALQVRGFRIESITSQRSDCVNQSASLSKRIESAMGGTTDNVIPLWKQQFPGLTYTTKIDGKAGQPVLLGIDTCSSSLNRDLLTFRGQLYENGIEIRFTSEFSPTEDMSQASLDELAKSLGNGSSTLYQPAFTAFRSVLESTR